jgi:rubrerythrin
MLRLAEFEDLSEQNGFAPPKFGKWILVKYYKDEEGNLCPIFRCSKCGIPYHEDKNYCPHCGSSMKS